MSRESNGRQPGLVGRRAMAKGVMAAASGMVAAAGRITEAQAMQTTSKTEQNKILVGRWFTEFWGHPWNPKIVDELAAPDMLLQFVHAPRRGRADVKAFMIGFREAFPDLSFSGAADLIAEGDYVVGRWIGGVSYGSGVQRLPARITSRRLRAQDAIYRDDGAEGREREDCGRGRIGRRGDGFDAARPASPVIACKSARWQLGAAYSGQRATMRTGPTVSLPQLPLPLRPHLIADPSQSRYPALVPRTVIGPQTARLDGRR